MDIPHTVRGQQVGTIPGVGIIARSRGSTSSAFEGALGFPLCSGLFVAVYFSSSTPLTDSAGTYGKYLVNGTVVSIWNREQLDTALSGVSLDGNLPAGRITARAAGHVISGTVTDCLGHPMPSVGVRGGGGTARTGSSGTYKLRVHRRGLIRVVAVGGARAVVAVVRVR